MPSSQPSRAAPLTPQQAAERLLLRRQARAGLLAFTQYTHPRYRVDPFHERLCAALEAVERGEIDRLMVNMPPRHGKSELVSRRFPAWFMGRNPHKTIISASYNSDLATDFGRDVKNIVATKEFSRVFSDPAVTLAADSRAANRWNTNWGGSYVAAGVNTAVTGRGAHILNIDDPYKDRTAADSALERKKVIEWYEAVAYTRLAPEDEGSAIMVTQTRWRDDDLSGELIARMAKARDEHVDRWHILSLPALIDPQTGEAVDEDDPEAVARAEPLSQRYPKRTLMRIRSNITPREWSSLYQQKPKPSEGAFFRRSWFNVVGAAPAQGTRVRAWDLAGSEDGDWTVGVLMSKSLDGRYYIEKVERFRGSPLEVRKRLTNTATQDGRLVRIRIPQDPGQAGKGQAIDMVAMLSGYIVKAERVDGDKETRASAFSSQAEAGNVFLVKGDWNEVFLDELEGFPLGKHDDQVDAAADAFNNLALKQFAGSGSMHG